MIIIYFSFRKWLKIRLFCLLMVWKICINEYDSLAYDLKLKVLIKLNGISWMWFLYVGIKCVYLLCIILKVCSYFLVRNIYYNLFKLWYIIIS